MKKLLFLLLVLGVIAMVGCAPGATLAGKAAAGDACSADDPCEWGLRCSGRGVCVINSVSQVDSAILAQDGSGNLALTATTTDADVDDAPRAILNWLYSSRTGVAPRSITKFNMPLDDLRFRDYSGNANHGSPATDAAGDGAPLPELTQGLLIDGARRSAISFNGDNYIGVPQSGSLNPGSDDFTVEFWVNSGTTGEGTLLSYRDPSGAERGWELRVDSTGVVTAELDPGVVGSLNIDPFSISGGGIVTTERLWYHVALVVDRDGEMELYVSRPSGATEAGAVDNLVLVDSTPIARVQGADISGVDLSPSDLNTDLIIGRGFNGIIDEVKIYNWALSDEQLDNYRSQSGSRRWVGPRIGSWSVDVTPYDGAWRAGTANPSEGEDGPTVTSNTVDVSMGIVGSLNTPNYCTDMGGMNTPPSLTLSGTETAGSLALVMRDISANNFVHWFVYGISPNGAVSGGTNGRNGYLRSRYDGPCPPVGDPDHTYVFSLYALDVAPGDVEEVCGVGASSIPRDLIAGSCEGNIIGSAARLSVDVEAQACSSNDDCGANRICALIGGSAGECVTANTCGNGLVEGTEQCDDGNTAVDADGDGITDGCSASCTTEEGYTCPLAGGGCTLLGVERENRAIGTGCTLNEQCESNYCDVFTRTAGFCAAADCGDGHIGGEEGCDGEVNCENYNVEDPSSPLPGVGCNLLCGNNERDTVLGLDEEGVEDENNILYTEACDDGDRDDEDGCSASCTIETGFTCDDAGCFSTLGDGILASNEGCDDGNLIDGDGCSAAGTNECGDGTRDITSPYTEACDDGNDVDEDGCSASCSIESGWNCPVNVASPTATSVCASTCGDSIVAVGMQETCDDGNTVSGDGCSSTCVSELLFCGDGACRIDQNEDWNTCPADCSRPQAGCGDGGIQAGEQCDDGNNVGGDGCAAVCTNECGDGFVDFADRTVGDSGAISYGDLDEYDEACDDGNTAAGDGCDLCVIETGFSCSGQPSLCYQSAEFVSIGGFRVAEGAFTEFQSEADRLISNREVVDREEFIGEIARLLRRLFS